MRVFSDDTVVITTATLAILSRRPRCSRVLCLLYCLSHFGQVCRYVDHGFHVICALGQVCCNVPYVFCSACALMYMYRGLNTCVNILSVTVPFSCFPLTAYYGRGVPRTVTLDHCPVVFPELLPWIIFICPGPRCSRYCNVIGQVCLRDMWSGVVSYCTFGWAFEILLLWDLRPPRVERLLCCFVFFAIGPSLPV